MEIGGLVGGIVLAHSFLFNKVNELVSNPYMDEIFHIPQTQKYCENDFTNWDPMITTFPGLYFISQPMARFFGCTTITLRAVNCFLFSILNLILFFALAKIHFPKKMRLVYVLASFSMPILYFFNFLYYTDVAATFFVLLMHYLNEIHFHKLSGLFGIVAVGFRQTNIIWVAFSCFHSIFGSFNAIHKKTDSLFDWIKQLISFIWSELFFFIIPNFFIHIGTGIAFAAFVFLNQGIVIGDRTAHSPSINVGQFLYFLASLLVFNIQHPMAYVKFLKRCSEKPFLSLLLGIASVLILIPLVDRYTPVHLYTLSDNRHYTFYIWKNIFAKYADAKYYAIPFYVFSFWFTWDNFRNTTHWLWKLALFTCIAAVLIPAPLFEFRYYVIPYFLIHLYSNQSTTGLSIQFLFNSTLNFITIWLFLFKPFQWPDSNDQQRFMW